MDYVIYCGAFDWVIGFSRCIHRAKLNLHSGNLVQEVIGYLHCLDGRDLPY
jgi:hypothetical protein